MKKTTNPDEGDRDVIKGESAANVTAPLSLHIRRLRQWYGDQGLSQEALAHLSGVSLRSVRRYESCRALPPVLEALLSLTLVLKVPLETLIDPRLIEELRQVIDVRRSAWQGMAGHLKKDEDGTLHAH